MPYCLKCRQQVSNVSEVLFRDGHQENWCLDCWNADVRERSARRKAELDAMPRCEVPGCKMRQTFIVAGGIGMCGRHLKRAQREHSRRMSGFGGMGLFMGANWTRDDLLKMAQARH